VRFEKLGDLFAPVLDLKQRLPDLKGVAASAAEPAISIAAQAEDDAEDTQSGAAKKSRKLPRARTAKRKV
jgi:hypothetical protein